MLPLEADAKRMRNVNRLLHRLVLPEQGLGPGLAGAPRAADGWSLTSSLGDSGKPGPSVALQRLGPAAPVAGMWGWESPCPAPHGLSASQAAGSLPVAAHVTHRACLLGSSTGVGGGGWATAGDLSTVPGGVPAHSDLGLQSQQDPGPFSRPVFVL